MRTLTDATIECGLRAISEEDALELRDSLRQLMEQDERVAPFFHDQMARQCPTCPDADRCMMGKEWLQNGERDAVEMRECARLQVNRDDPLPPSFREMQTERCPNCPRAGICKIGQEWLAQTVAEKRDTADAIARVLYLLNEIEARHQERIAAGLHRRIAIDPDARTPANMKARLEALKEAHRLRGHLDVKR
jgi:hypothetical protein